jgi:MoaA/NifB/PqqE/SkfB family radical SAM enzyme
MKNPFLAEKFLWNYNKKDLKQLVSDKWYRTPPVSVEIDPTNVCNSDCVWCMFDEYRMNNQVTMPPDIMKRVIFELGDIGTKTITFTGGGEPFCNTASFPDAFYWVLEAGMKVGIVTNGVGAEPYIDDIGKTCSFCRFSIDAAKPETYEKLHRSNKFNTVIDNVRSLKNKYPKLDVGMAFLVHPDNYTEVSDFINIGNDIGVDYVEFRPVWMPGKPISKEIALNVIEQIKNTPTKESTRVFARLGRFQEHIDGDKGFSECLATPLVGVIGADMNVYLCCQTRGEPYFILGNINKSSFSEIWWGEQRKKIVNGIDINKCPPCRYNTYNKVLSSLKNCTHEEFL